MTANYIVLTIFAVILYFISLESNDSDTTVEQEKSLSDYVSSPIVTLKGSYPFSLEKLLNNRRSISRTLKLDGTYVSKDTITVVEGVIKHEFSFTFFPLRNRLKIRDATYSGGELVTDITSEVFYKIEGSALNTFHISGEESIFTKKGIPIDYIDEDSFLVLIPNDTGFDEVRMSRDK